MNEDPQLTILLQAYLAERADDTPATTAFLSLLAAILGFLTIIGFGLTHASSVPAWAIAVIPLPTIPFIAFGTIIAHASQVRGWTIDDYERRLRALAPSDIADQIAPPYGHTLLNRVVWQNWFAKTAIGVAFGALFPLYVGVLVVSYRESHRQEPAIALLSLIGCSAALLLLVIFFGIALRPGPNWARGVAAIQRDDLTRSSGVALSREPDAAQTPEADVPEKAKRRAEQDDAQMPLRDRDDQPGGPTSA